MDWNNKIFYSKNKNKTNSPLLQDGKTITDQKHIAEDFNNFFTSIGKKLQKNIPSTKKHFSSLLKNPNNFFCPNLFCHTYYIRGSK